MTFGIPVCEMLDSIEPSELTYWRVYHQQTMFGPMAGWWRWSHDTAMQVNSGRGKAEKKLQLRDLLPEVYR
jgi:hypothetical protein